MRYFVTVLAVGVMLLQATGALANDADLTQRLLGTWIDDPASKAPLVSTVTYNADGNSIASMWERGQPESTGVQITVRWSIKDGIFSLKSVTSSDPNRVPVGLELKDRIVSISEDRFVFEALEGYGDAKGKQDTRIRKK